MTCGDCYDKDQEIAELKADVAEAIREMEATANVYARAGQPAADGLMAAVAIIRRRPSFRNEAEGDA